jgi:hypothetical protein
VVFAPQNKILATFWHFLTVRYGRCAYFCSMRKLLLLCVTLCYLATATGVAVQWHYCMGKLQGIQLGLSLGNDGCSACGMKKQGASDCCKDVVTVSKISDEHHQAPAHGLPSASTADVLLRFAVDHPRQTRTADVVILHKSHPPPLQGVHWQSFHGQFRC